VQATMLAEKHGLRVVVVDPALERAWVPNYGVWLEEWQALDELLDIGLGDCLARTWEVSRLDTIFSRCKYITVMNVEVAAACSDAAM
jgi:hypothetical protein